MQQGVKKTKKKKTGKTKKVLDKTKQKYIASERKKSGGYKKYRNQVGRYKNFTSGKMGATQ